jgi:type I restriction enzyme S subunit
MATSQDFVNWVCDPDLLAWTFLRWVLMSERESFLRFASGTTHQTIYFPEVKALHILLPPIDEQRRIAAVLDTLERKIENLDNLSRRSEDLMTVLFRGLIAEADWPLTTVNECFTVIMGQSPRGTTYTSDPEGALPLVQGMGAFGRRFPATDVFTTAPTKRAQPGDVLLTVRAPVGEVNIVRDELCAGRGVAAIRSEHPAYAEQVMRSLRSSWAAQESGTIFPAVNGKQIAQMRVVEPPIHRVDQFEASARPLYDLAHGAEQQTSRLRAIRDELLPKLVSGKLRVADDYLADAAPVTVG